MEDIENLFKNADFSKETDFQEKLKEKLDSWIDKLEENNISNNDYLLSDDELDLAVAAAKPFPTDEKK